MIQSVSIILHVNHFAVHPNGAKHKLNNEVENKQENKKLTHFHGGTEAKCDSNHAQGHNEGEKTCHLSLMLYGS